MSKIKLSSIVAMAENNVIGKDNQLLWHIPADFKHFKSTTMGCPLIMGRKTFESLPGILPGRPHIVISRSAQDTSQQAPPTPMEEKPPLSWSHYVKSIEDSIELGKEIAEQNGVQEAFIIGGGEIYKQTLPLIDRLYLTLVHHEYEGDTYFPEINWDNWNITREERHEGDPAFTFFTLEKK